MRIAVKGIVVNQFGQVLIIKRDDTRTWAIPGGALEANELPPDAAAREVEEETGQQVHPVRLVGVFYWQNRVMEHLAFSFRCLPAGGDVRKTDDSVAVGYANPSTLPRSMVGPHRERIEIGLNHKGGPPYWGRQESPAVISFLVMRLLLPLVYRWKDLRRRRRNEPPFRPAPEWTTGAFAVIRNEAGQVLWVKRRDYDVWNLPGGRSAVHEAPWDTAVRETREETGLAIDLVDLSGVYVKPDQLVLIFTFTAAATGGTLQLNPEATDFAYFTPGQEPANSLPKHLTRVADAVDPDRQITRFRQQDGPSGVEVLGLEKIG